MNQAIAMMPEEGIRKPCMTSTVDFIDSYGVFPGMFRTCFPALCEGALMTCDIV